MKLLKHKTSIPTVHIHKQTHTAGNFTLLHGKRDETVVFLNVAFQDVRAGPQHALEASSVQLDALELPSRDDGGGAGPVEQKRDLTCNNKWPC